MATFSPVVVCVEGTKGAGKTSTIASARALLEAEGWAVTLHAVFHEGNAWAVEQGFGGGVPMIEAGAEILGPWGWVLRRETWGFAVDADDGLWHLFSAAEDEGKRYRLTAIEDRNRNRIALSYEAGRLIEVKDSAGRIVRVVPTKEGRIGSIQVLNAVAQGRWIAFGTYAYDESGGLISVRDADGYVSSYAYDAEHRLTTDTDRTGLTFHFVYDREGRCVESWGDYPGRKDPSLADDLPVLLADGKTRAKGIHHCRFDYMPGGYSEVADSTQVRRFFGNKHGTLDKSVEGTSVTEAKYRKDGHLLSRTDALGAITQFERDARGRVIKRTDPLGRVTTVERDVYGLPMKVVDPAGWATTMVRDRYGNVEVFTDATGAVTCRRFDSRGQMVELVAPNGVSTICEYDTQGNLIALTQPNGGMWRYTYDALGRRRMRIGAPQTRHGSPLRL